MSVETYVPEKKVPNTPVVTATASAVKHFEQKLKAMPGKIIRLSTKLSGCTGFAYVVDYANEPAADDEVVTLSDTVVVAVAKDALPILKNTELDYVKEGINGILKFNNPNVVDACGCGESFSVA
ncbi:HesB/IscA family protein [Aliidiomarina celeris]|uniref:HesB/IscA family protein n=1 Tax=Aliidiomarina celeris TaxID=2249428 RepID=UPI000DEACC26|nr:iron-sulfur cluster assembly accessory protein [Aliidiomarina celeris]